MRFRMLRTAFLPALLSVAPASAQVSSASAGALGMADNYTAAARGYDAVAWNPSVLGLLTSPGMSFTLLALRGGNGLAPVTLGDLADWADQVVPDAVRRDWLSRIAADGAQRGAGTVEATWVALQIDRMAFHASTRVRAETDVSPGVAELIMFGNAGSEGAPRDIDLSGSSLGARAWTSLGASFALPYDVDVGRLALGATVHFTVGHLLATGERSTGQATSAPVGVIMDFPLVQTTLDSFEPNGGSGFGLDLAASVESGPWTLSAVARNVASTFAWNLDRLEYRPLSLAVDETDADTDTEALPLAAAPGDVRAQIEQMGFERSWAFAAAVRPQPGLLITSDARFAQDDGMLAQPLSHVGTGIELHVLPWLPLRAGASRIHRADDSEAWQIAGGFGIRAGAWGLNAGIARETSDRLGGSTVFMLSLISVGAH